MLIIAPFVAGLVVYLSKCCDIKKLLSTLGSRNAAWEKDRNIRIKSALTIPEDSIRLVILAP
jgi:hypothetical protein